MSYVNAIYVGAGAFVGANLRYGVGLLSTRMMPAAGAYAGTFVVNVVGAFLLATLLAWFDRQIDMPPQARLLLATGFFGSFTTFSTFAHEGVALYRGGNLWAAMGYIIGTNVVGVVAVFGGIWLGNRL
ncbi:MAG: fluoride efflux transporter CrcB [Chloroflexota bacterium]